MTTHAPSRPLPLSQEMRRQCHLPNDTELHHDDPVAPVLASVLCDTHIVVRTPIAHSCRNGEPALAALDYRCDFGNAKHQGKARWNVAAQTRSTHVSDSY